MTGGAALRTLLAGRRGPGRPARWPSQRAAASPDDRANRLLDAHLTTEQADTLAHHGWFDVTSQHGHRYRIYRGQVVNVYRLVTGGSGHARPVAGYCLRSDAALPDADVMLTQLLLLRTDEDAFLAEADRCDLRPPRRRDLRRRR
jgi:hypothetical protein